MTEMPPADAHAHLGPDQAPCERCYRPFIKRRPWARYCSTACKDQHHKETLEADARDAVRYRKLRAGLVDCGLYVADGGRDWRRVEGEELDQRIDDAECKS